MTLLTKPIMWFWSQSLARKDGVWHGDTSHSMATINTFCGLIDSHGCAEAYGSEHMPPKSEICPDCRPHIANQLMLASVKRAPQGSVSSLEELINQWDEQ